MHVCTYVYMYVVCIYVCMYIFMYSMYLYKSVRERKGEKEKRGKAGE